MNLAAEAHELLTTDSWTLEECNEWGIAYRHTGNRTTGGKNVK
jgi:hypothetical protein